jgi:hypothetical protein
VRGLLETHPARQLLELVAADDELASLAVDVTEARLRGDDTI